MVVALIRFLVKFAVGFIALSLLLVVAYKWLPVPITVTMATDPYGMTRKWVPIEDVDRDMIRAVIAAEDGKFCQHKGFDAEAIEQAIEESRRGKRLRGASTISQQTAKNVFLWQNGGFLRKGLEAWFTFHIERIWGKKRIMEVYLNVAETGRGTYGVEAGAMRYFGHSAARLSEEEAARMAAVLPSPKTRAAVNPRGFTRRYGNSIRARMRVIAREGLDRCVFDGAGR